jgi:hypothetical protein
MRGKSSGLITRQSSLKWLLWKKNVIEEILQDKETPKNILYRGGKLPVPKVLRAPVSYLPCSHMGGPAILLHL